MQTTSVNIDNVFKLAKLFLNVNTGQYITLQENEDTYSLLVNNAHIGAIKKGTDIEFQFTDLALHGLLIIKDCISELVLMPLATVDVSQYIAQKTDAPIVTPVMVDHVLARCSVSYVEQQEPFKVMHCNVAKGNFILGTAFSKAAIVANYSEKDGKFYSHKNAMQTATSKIWQMEGYLLDKLFN